MENYDRQKLVDLCIQYDIDQRIPKFYLDYDDKRLAEDGEDLTKLVLPCGVGKTVGLAIALAARKNMYIMYVASNHKRLEEFGNTLTEFGVDYTYIRSSQEINVLGIVNQTCVLMTTSMLLQFFGTTFAVRFGMGGKILRRTLIIDECPKLMTPILYCRTLLYSFRETCDKLGLIINYDYKPPFIKLSYFPGALMKALFRFGAFRVLGDLAINSDKHELESEIDLEAKCFFIARALARSPREDLRAMITNQDLEIARNEKMSRMVLSAEEVYGGRFNKTLILDATADLSENCLKGTTENLGIEKSYNKYINKVINLNNYYQLLDNSKEKSGILIEFVDIFMKIKPLLDKTGKRNYIVTYKDAIYDQGDIRCDLIEYMNSQYENFEVDPEGDYLRWWTIQKDKFGDEEIYETMISNYNRNRGTNKFRNCDNVVLIGQFNYPLNDIESLLEGLKETADKYEIQHDLSVSDAVQEISRGCLRKRLENNKENIYLFGDSSWIDSISSYLKVPTSEVELELEKSLEVKLLLYLKYNQDSIRKANYCKVVNLILQDSEYSPRLYLNYEWEILKHSNEFPRDFSRPMSFIKIIKNELNLTEEEINRITSWK